MAHDYTVMTSDLIECRPSNQSLPGTVRPFWVLENEIIKAGFPWRVITHFIIPERLNSNARYLYAFHQMTSNHLTNIISLILHHSFVKFPS